MLAKSLDCGGGGFPTHDIYGRTKTVTAFRILRRIPTNLLAPRNNEANVIEGFLTYFLSSCLASLGREDSLVKTVHYCKLGPICTKAAGRLVCSTESQKGILVGEYQECPVEIEV